MRKHNIARCLNATTILTATTHLVTALCFLLFAEFLRSTSLSCTRTVTPQSCTTDPNLNARSYFSDLSLLKVSTLTGATKFSP